HVSTGFRATYPDSIEHRFLQTNDFLLNRVLHQLRLIVDVELAHEIEFMRFDGLDAEIETGGYLFDRKSFGEHFEYFSFALGEGSKARLSHGRFALHAEIVD